MTAYNILLIQGKRGDVYNICSGRGRAIQNIVTMLSDILGIYVEINQELSQIRPIDNPRIIGNNEKMRREMNWYPRIGFEETLRSMVDYWEQRLQHRMKTEERDT